MDFRPLISQGDQVFSLIEKRNAHLDHPDAIINPEDTQRIIDQLNRLISSLPDIQSPQNVDELLTAELKRRAVGEKEELSSQLSSEVPTLEETLAIYNIPPQDINSLPEWLHKNKPAVVSANQRLIEEHITHRQVKVFMGSSELKSQAETLVLNALISLKSVLRNHFLKLPGVSDFLDNYHIVIDSIETRAYTNWIANVMAITSIGCTRMFHKSVYLVPEKLLAQFGHEGLGHSANHAITASSSFPYFIKSAFTNVNSSTKESVAQYFEQKIFDILKDNPTATSELKLDESFETIYKRYQDALILQQYWKHLGLYATLTLARSRAGEEQKQHQEISKYSIEPRWPSGFINRNRNNWDKLTGRLLPRVTKELIYAADPVGRIMKSTPDKPRTDVERFILTGLWTPAGLEQWVKLNLEGKVPPVVS